MDQKKSSNPSTPSLPELLAPAGSFEKLVTAIHYGADAVYLGGSKYGLRAKAGNFSNDSIRDAVIYAHKRKVKLYVTINIIAHDDDFEGLEDYFHLLHSAGVDGVIISDPGILTGTLVTAVVVPADFKKLKFSIRNALQLMLSEGRDDAGFVLQYTNEGTAMRRMEFYTSSAPDSLRPTYRFTLSTPTEFGN